MALTASSYCNNTEESYHIAGTVTATAAGQVDAASRGAQVSVSRVVFAEVNNDRCCRRSGGHN